MQRKKRAYFIGYFLQQRLAVICHYGKQIQQHQVNAFLLVLEELIAISMEVPQSYRTMTTFT